MIKMVVVLLLRAKTVYAWLGERAWYHYLGVSESYKDRDRR
jgi:hypothetical protein